MKCLRNVVCLLLLLALLPTVAFAQTQEEWNLSCNLKTSGSTTVYKIGTESEVQETIPANTYVKVYDSTGNDMKKIRYMIGGSIRTGKVYSSDLVKCTSSVRGSSGYAEGVHELDPNHDQILQSSVVITVAESLLQNGTTDYSGLNFSTPDSPSAQAAQATAGRTGASTQSDSSSARSAQRTETAEELSANQGGIQVTLEQLGTTTSKISYQGSVSEVPTSELMFGNDVPDDKKIAVVYAPRTGKASLREKASTSADVITKCKAGTIVSVLEYGKKFCKITYDGSVGYILTSCLQFHAPTEQPVGEAVLTYNGKATGRTTINVRNDADGDSAKITEWRTGTKVLVFGQENGWYEIEANGMRGYVKDDFLTMEDDAE